MATKKVLVHPFYPHSYDIPWFENASLYRKLWQKILEQLATSLSGLPMSCVKLHILQRFFDSYSAPCLQRKCDVHHHFARFLNQNARFGLKLLLFPSKMAIRAYFQWAYKVHVFPFLPYDSVV